jgi:hypothetical protein
MYFAVGRDRYQGITHHNALDDNPVFTEAQNTIGQLIMFVQVTNACFSTRVKYGEPMLSFMDKVFAQIDPDKVLGHAPCLSEFMKEPVTQYGITIISPMIMIGCLFAAYFISLFGCNGKLMFDGVFNVVGEVLVEFYISVTWPFLVLLIATIIPMVQGQCRSIQ